MLRATTDIYSSGLSRRFEARLPSVPLGVAGIGDIHDTEMKARTCFERGDRACVVCRLRIFRTPMRTARRARSVRWTTVSQSPMPRMPRLQGRRALLRDAFATIEEAEKRRTALEAMNPGLRFAVVAL